MGQKGSPTGFRLPVTKAWASRWFAGKKEFGKHLEEDRNIRSFLYKQPSCMGTSKIMIKRMSDKIEVTINTARPGLVIGRKGAEIDVLKEKLRKLTGKEVWVEVEEIKRPDLDAQSVASAIKRQIERRIPFRRVLKKTIETSMDAGAAGIKVQLAGRLGGAEIARSERGQEGQVPLHTLRARIDYAKARAQTTYGIIGIQVWINLGEEE